MTKKEWTKEINSTLEMLNMNERYMEDCKTVVERLQDNEVEYLAQKTQRQHGWDFSDVFDIVEKRVKLKLALFLGQFPAFKKIIFHKHVPSMTLKGSIIFIKFFFSLILAIFMA